MVSLRAHNPAKRKSSKRSNHGEEPDVRDGPEVFFINDVSTMYVGEGDILDLDA